MRRTVEAIVKGAMAMTLLGAVYACTEAGQDGAAEGPPGPAVVVDPAGPEADEPAGPGPQPVEPVEPPAAEVRRPRPVKGLGDAVVLAASESGGPTRSASVATRPAIAAPPLPSADRAGGADGSGGFSGADRRSRAGAAPGTAMLAAAPPSPGPAAPAAAAVAREEAAAPAVGASGVGLRGAGPAPAALGELLARPVAAVPFRRVLTAAAVADVDHRDEFRGFLERWQAEGQALGLDLSRRVRFLVVDAEDRPVHDATVTVIGQGGSAVGRTHADGIWDFHPSFSAPALGGPVAVHVQIGGLSVAASASVPVQGDGGEYVIRLPGVAAESPRILDLAFLIDVTGSMSDELLYVNEEVTGIVDRVRAAVPGVQVRVAATFYRDRGDSVPLEQIPFSTELGDFVARMRFVSAQGGGDYPEDVDSGLAAALGTLAWSQERAARVLVIIGDAPPQRYQDAQYRYTDAMSDATLRGIRLLPVAASGADRTVEHLFRAMGALTSTPYVYLTDDSGIGGSHMEADSDEVSREMFSDLLTRLLVADLQGEGMHA